MNLFQKAGMNKEMPISKDGMYQERYSCVPVQPIMSLRFEKDSRPISPEPHRQVLANGTKNYQKD